MWKHPPGDEVYRKGSISVFEVDGKKNKVRRHTHSFCFLVNIKRLVTYSSVKRDKETLLFICE